MLSDNEWTCPQTFIEPFGITSISDMDMVMHCAATRCIEGVKFLNRDFGLVSSEIMGGSQGEDASRKSRIYRNTLCV